jgi:hypothetical protein
MGGGTIAEKVYGTEEGRRKNRIMDSQMTHWGEQTGLVKDKFDQEMTNLGDAFSRSDLNVTNWGKQDSKDQGAQTAVGKYSTSAQARGKSRKSGAKGSQLETRESRKIKGKGKLYVTK